MKLPGGNQILHILTFSDMIIAICVTTTHLIAVWFITDNYMLDTILDLIGARVAECKIMLQGRQLSW